MKVDCRSCIYSFVDQFRGVMKCTKANTYCHYDNPTPFGQLTTRMIPDIGVENCPGMEEITFVGQPDNVR